MFSDVLLTVDYDRTLTSPDSTIPQRNLEAIRYFMANGGKFTVNTGRSVPMSAKNILNNVPVNAPLLLYNGSAAYDTEKNELTLCRPIPLDPRAVITDVQERFPQLTVEWQGVDAHYIFYQNPAWEAYIQGKYGDVLDCFQACTRITDMHAKGCSKLRSARELQAMLNRKILVCVGDGDNDLTMLEGADYAFCPADGSVAHRFPNVCPCGEGAVAEVIYEKIPAILKNKP